MLVSKGYRRLLDELRLTPEQRDEEHSNFSRALAEFTIPGSPTVAEALRDWPPAGTMH